MTGKDSDDSFQSNSVFNWIVSSPSAQKHAVLPHLALSHTDLYQYQQMMLGAIATFSNNTNYLAC